MAHKNRIEAREITQDHYGGYCNMCRVLNITSKPYHTFDLVEYNTIKNKFKMKKKLDKM